ncbi:hypothetical protein C1Y22_36855, partial [Pseudomonas sp. MPR-R2A5]|uniref:hypothetical protein n=1 Tax=Pseudomonas sp. MPR-R2A5 TaxID=2070622 RepID=UPI000CA68410
LDGVPNGLSDMNGTLIFTDDRLQVQSLTAKTGGGDLKIGGSLRFRNGTPSSARFTESNCTLPLNAGLVT